MLPSAGPRLEPTAFIAACAAFPLIDARTPSEYARGHIPGAVNLPLFTDAEHAVVGIAYKERGRSEAVVRGLEAVGPRLPETARALLSLGPRLFFYCARGGMRSSSLAGLAETLGQEVRILHGGYKAFRHFALELFERPPALQVLGGKTGSGKTEVLAVLREHGEQVVDLEALALHRGSAFGGFPDKPQPTQSQFENNLAVALAACDFSRPIWVEDESENIGRVNLPRSFFLHLRREPLFVLHTPESGRLRRVLADYSSLPAGDIGDSLDRIKKRLGGAEHAKARQALEQGDLAVVAELLLAYYDRAYAKQLRDRPLMATIEAESPATAVGLLVKASARDREKQDRDMAPSLDVSSM